MVAAITAINGRDSLRFPLLHLVTGTRAIRCTVKTWSQELIFQESIIFMGNRPQDFMGSTLYFRRVSTHQATKDRRGREGWGRGEGKEDMCLNVIDDEGR